MPGRVIIILQIRAIFDLVGDTGDIPNDIPIGGKGYPTSRHQTPHQLALPGRPHPRRKRPAVPQKGIADRITGGTSWKNMESWNNCYFSETMLRSGEVQPPKVTTCNHGEKTRIAKAPISAFPQCVSFEWWVVKTFGHRNTINTKQNRCLDQFPGSKRFPKVSTQGRPRVKPG